MFRFLFAYSLLQYKPNLPPVVLRSGCKVQPIDIAGWSASLTPHGFAFQKEFIKVLVFLVGNVKYYYHIAEGLLIITCARGWCQSFRPCLLVSNAR